MSQSTLTFVIQNTWTQLYGADHFAIKFLSRELAYPTQVATSSYRQYRSGAPVDDQESNWDGWVRLLRLPKTKPPWMPSGLVPRAVRLCHKMKIPCQVDDRRQRPETGFPDFPEIPLREYQREGVERALKAGFGVLNWCPRAGKTRAAAEIVRRIGLPTLWIAPTDRIVDQTHRVLIEFFGENFAARVTGSTGWESERGKRVIVATAATATLLPVDFYQTREVIIVDEVHHAAAKSWQNDIFRKCDHIFFRIGLTGTFYRSGEDELNLHAFLSSTIHRVTSQELVGKDFLVPTRVAILPVKAKRLTGIPSKTFQSGHGKMGIHEHKGRTQLAAAAAVQLAGAGRKVLVLVGTKVQGRGIKHALDAFFPKPQGRTEFDPVEFVSTDVMRPKQRRMIEAFLGSDEVRVLIGTSLLGEGVDLPEADALVYARGEKARVSLAQSAYRVNTKSEGKRDAVIVDFADRHNAKLLRHSLERIEIYHREPTFTVEVIDDVRQIGEWSARNGSGDR